ncbi:DUF1229 domain-containing protein [Leptospira vanthielii]|uniref:DUF1229 domain-containing protein n=1 Tax=Leptospira vanthielii TaxID=293085 RepID=A0ABY2NTI6_9LEPT|nr:DUF1229 domain-containing protein [Leptospira vanthielii]
MSEILDKIQGLNRKYLKKILFSQSSYPIPKVCFYLLGIGIYSLRITLVVSSLCLIHYIYNFSFRKFSFNKLILFIFWTVFICIYYLQYKLPFFPPEFDGSLSLVVYLVRAIPLLLLILVSLQLKNKSIYFNLVFLFSLGMLTHAILNTVNTVIISDPPYYGRVYEFFTGGRVNSPGTTLLASFSSLLLLGFVGDKKVQKKKLLFVFLFITFLISAAISLTFLARTYFFVLAIGTILIAIRYASETGKISFFLLSLFLSVTLLASAFKFLLPANLSDRIINGVYSMKIQHNIDYFNQIGENFFIYPKSYITLDVYWFHNFFYDVHRSSGPYAAICAYGIVLITSFSIVVNWEKRYTKSLLIIFSLFIPYLLTTIPWESSEYQIIVLFAGFTMLVAD